MSELNAQTKKKPNGQQNSYEQQQSDKKFFRKLFTDANEFSKKLAIIDSIIYVLSFIVLIVVLLLRPDLSALMIQIFPYITTIFITLRGSYTLKSGVENYKKISTTVQTIDTNMELKNTEDEDSAG